MKEYYLYAIVVEKLIWGELPVHKGNHYEIHAIPVELGEPEEDVVNGYIWGLRCEEAERYGCPKSFCANCAEESGDCDCEEPDFYEEDYSEFVERLSSFHAVKYDPTNIDHVCCPGAEKYRDIALKLEIEHKENVERIKCELLREFNKAEQLRLQLKVAEDRISRLNKELAALEE